MSLKASMNFEFMASLLGQRARPHPNPMRSFQSKKTTHVNHAVSKILDGEGGHFPKTLIFFLLAQILEGLKVTRSSRTRKESGMTPTAKAGLASMKHYLHGTQTGTHAALADCYRYPASCDYPPIGRLSHRSV